MFSAYNTDVPFCEFLIKHGARVNPKDKKGYTALEYVLDHSIKATTEDDVNQIITMLLEQGAKIRPITLKAALSGGSNNNETRYSLVKRVVEGVIKEGNKTGINNVLEAAIVGDSSKINKLIYENRMEKEYEQQILFYTAASNNHYEVSKYLIEMAQLLMKYKADPSLKNKEGYTASDLAKDGKYMDIVEYLKNTK